MGRLEGRVALVTGAARGQGRSHAAAFAAEGADIIAVDICRQIESVSYDMSTPADLAETARLIEEQDRRVLTIEADARSEAEMTAAVERGIAELGKIDIVAINHGIASYAPVWQLTEAQWDDMLDTNLKGVWVTAKAVTPHMIERRGGSIIITSSTAGLKGIANIAHYSAAKHGVVGLARVLAIELAPYMIRVNTVHPTTVNTPMVMNEATMRLFGGGQDITQEQFAEVATAMNLLPVPWVEARDISAAYVFLASDESRYVTGVQLPVDAGFMTK